MRLFLVSVLLLAASAVANAATYEARSPHHAVKVDVVSGNGDDISFAVTVTELPSGRVLTTEHLAGKKGAPIEKQAGLGDQLFRIDVGLSGTNVVCKVRIERGDRIVDSIQGVWATQQVLSPFAKDGGPIRVGGDVKAPVLIHREAAVYTDLARRARVEGTVIVEAIIDRTGGVKDAHVVKALPFGLNGTALEAVRKWKFRPAIHRGKAVDVFQILNVDFHLPAQPSPARPPAPQ
jgi:TonB family protein